MGSPMDIEPHEAILWCVRIAAGEVAFMTTMIGTIDSDPQEQLIESYIGGRQLNLWVRERHHAMERLARWSKLALDAGVAERQVRVAERYGELIARLLENVFAALKLTPAQQKAAPEIVRQQLIALESGLKA